MHIIVITVRGCPNSNHIERSTIDITMSTIMPILPFLIMPFFPFLPFLKLLYKIKIIETFLNKLN